MQPHDNAATTNAHAAALSDSLRALIDESKALRQDVDQAERTRRREARLNAVMIGILSLFVLCVLAVAWQNNAIAQQTADTNRQITSCTVPGGKCYEDGRARTTEAVSNIYKSSVYMAECARLQPGVSGADFDRFLEKCVADKIAGSRATPAPVPTR
jgi:type VI protein secretion system component VasK